MDTENKANALLQANTSEMDNTHSGPETHTGNGITMETKMGNGKNLIKENGKTSKTNNKLNSHYKNTSLQT